MQSREGLEQDKYVFVKNHAYITARFLNELTMKQFSIFLKTAIPYEKESLEYEIFVTTLLLPNDLEFIDSYIANKDMNALSKKYNLPIGFLLNKVIELGEYHFLDLIENGKIDKGLASQNINLLKILDTIDCSLLTFFPNQPYIERKKWENEQLRQQILKDTYNFKL